MTRQKSVLTAVPRPQESELEDPIHETAARPVLNDIHSALNATRVDEVVAPSSLVQLQEYLSDTSGARRTLSIAGGRHAMGGQQFGEDTLHLDTCTMNKVLSFDARRGIVEAEAGIQWPELVGYLLATQGGEESAHWGIVQKQTGADRLSLGGALSANAHGRGLKFQPFVQDIESFVLVDATGEARTCSRTENSDLFALAIGGYGLFGIVYSVRLRLARRAKLERVVDVIDCHDLPAAFVERIRSGFDYGDFQFAIDPETPDFLRTGVFSCYRPVARDAAVSAGRAALDESQWRELLALAHTNKARAFQRYADYYRSTSGQLYWSDTHQASIYPDGYHLELDGLLGAPHRGSEMITELYVPRERLPEFLTQSGHCLRETRADLIYGTVRLIEKDTTTFLPWAGESWACTVMNLHVNHHPAGIEQAKRQFRGLIDVAQSLGGSYFLTYHRWATRAQVLRSYPRFPDFLRRKRDYDPGERFQSQWYRHYREMFA